jgi:hypothetical protein
MAQYDFEDTELTEADKAERAAWRFIRAAAVARQFSTYDQRENDGHEEETRSS